MFIFSATHAMLERHPASEYLAYIIKKLMEPDIEDTVPEEAEGIAFLYSKAELNAFARNIG